MALPLLPLAIGAGAFGASALARALGRRSAQRAAAKIGGTLGGTLAPQEAGGVVGQAPTGGDVGFFRGLVSDLRRDPVGFLTGFGALKEGPEPRVDFSKPSTPQTTPPPSQPSTPIGSAQIAAMGRALEPKPTPMPAGRPPAPAFTGGVGVKPPTRVPEESPLPPVKLPPGVSPPGVVPEAVRKSWPTDQIIPTGGTSYMGGPLVQRFTYGGKDYSVVIPPGYQGGFEHAMREKLASLGVAPFATPQIATPQESPLPPAQKRLSEIAGPVGKFDAMIRALLQAQQMPSRFVQMPLAGAAPFGPASGMERALRKLRERELARVGITA